MTAMCDISNEATLNRANKRNKDATSNSKGCYSFKDLCVARCILASESGNCTSRGIGTDVTCQWLPDVSTQSRDFISDSEIQAWWLRYIPMGVFQTGMLRRDWSLEPSAAMVIPLHWWRRTGTRHPSTPPLELDTPKAVVAIPYIKHHQNPSGASSPHWRCVPASDHTGLRDRH